MNPARILAVVLWTSLFGCTSLTPLSESESAAIVSEVTACTRAFEEAERQRDVEGLLAHLAPGFFMYQDGQRVDYEATVSQIRSSLPTLQVFDTEFSDVRVTVLGPAGAVVSLTFRDEITDAAGTTTRQRGATTLAWKRQGGSWRIVYAHAEHHPDE